MQDQESKKISFWANSMHNKQLELLITRFKNNNSYIDLLFEKGLDARMFPGVLETFAFKVQNGDALLGIEQNTLLAHKIFEQLNQNRTLSTIPPKLKDY